MKDIINSVETLDELKKKSIDNELLNHSWVQQNEIISTVTNTFFDVPSLTLWAIENNVLSQDAVVNTLNFILTC